MIYCLGSNEPGQPPKEVPAKWKLPAYMFDDHALLHSRTADGYGQAAGAVVKAMGIGESR